MDLKAQKTLAAAVFEAQKTVSPYTTTATVTSISGNTAYVKIAGSDISTPVEASTVTVKPGDIIDLSVSHADTHITGNRSDKSVTESSVQKTAEVKIVEILQDKYITAEKIETTYIKSEKVEADYITAKEIESKYLTSEYIKSNYITANKIKADYADIKLANVEKADIGTLLANIGLISTATISDGHVTGYLDSVKINADKITAGTLSVERLVISGTNKSIIYAINNSGKLASDTVDTIDGDVITKKTITADHIVAGAITSSEIHANAITSEKILANAVTSDKINVESLESISAKIGSFTIESALYTNEHSAYNSNVNGVYLGSDYISFGKSGKTWFKNDLSASIGSGGIAYDAETGSLDIVANSVTVGSKNVAVVEDIIEASKTADNFLSYDSMNGVQIGNKTSGSWVGTRARITNSSFDILDSSGDVLSSYGETTTIGKVDAENIYIDGDNIGIRKGTKVIVTINEYGMRIANSNDASGSLGSGDSKPALIIGTETGYHIEMDNNEIMAKSNATTSSNLFLNTEGGNVSINNNCSRAIMFQDGVIFAKNKNYNGGSYLGILDGLNENGNTTLGYGGYLNNIGSTNIYGEKVLLCSNSGITIEDTVGNEGLRVYGTDQVSIGCHGYSNNQGTTYLSGYDVWIRSSNYVYSDRRLRVLWSGAYYMKDGQEISLSDAISNQLTGIILAWSAYENSSAENYDWNYVFVPKEHALRHSGAGVAMLLISGTGWTRGSKYVYIFDNKITGHANNNKVSTEENGWIVNPSGFVLRYVYGV